MTNALEAWNVNLNLNMNQGCWEINHYVLLILTTKYSDNLILLITYNSAHFMKEIWHCNITNYIQFQFFKPDFYIKINLIPDQANSENTCQPYIMI